MVNDNATARRKVATAGITMVTPTAITKALPLAIKTHTSPPTILNTIHAPQQWTIPCLVSSSHWSKKSRSIAKRSTSFSPPSTLVPFLHRLKSSVFSRHTTSIEIEENVPSSSIRAFAINRHGLPLNRHSISTLIGKKSSKASV